MMTLITGFTCPPTSLLQSATAFFITKCDGMLLQSATGIIKCDNFITKCDDYYKVRQYIETSNSIPFQEILPSLNQHEMEGWDGTIVKEDKHFPYVLSILVVDKREVKEKNTPPSNNDCRICIDPRYL